jgi:hypothetical protein
LIKDNNYYSPSTASASSPYWRERASRNIFPAHTSQIAAMKNQQKWAVETDPSA